MRKLFLILMMSMCGNLFAEGVVLDPRVSEDSKVSEFHGQFNKRFDNEDGTHDFRHVLTVKYKLYDANGDFLADKQVPSIELPAMPQEQNFNDFMSSANWGAMRCVIWGIVRQNKLDFSGNDIGNCPS